MKTRWAKRRPPARGFVLAEALVSLTVAALTLALLTSATWGLRQTAMQPSSLQQEATDWLTARRVLQAWAASATTDGISGLESRFTGSPTQMRVVLDDGTSRDNRPIMISLDISQEDGLHRLTATRHIDVRDVRLGTETAPSSTIIVSDQPLSLVYYVAARGDRVGRVWTYEPRLDQGLPAAIGVERGSERMIVAQMPVTRSAQCVSRFGANGMGEQDCALR
jgi:hypothetical protein